MDLLKESASKFKYYASGRRFVEGMLVTLDLRARQDIIMGYLVNMLLPQDDLIDFEVSPMRLPPPCHLTESWKSDAALAGAGKPVDDTFTQVSSQCTFAERMCKHRALQ